jgi:hypothetical protein
VTVWDPKSGTRERLFLLLHIGNSDPGPWIYNSVSDRWSNGTTGYRVSSNADDTLAVLQSRGLSRDAAFDLIWSYGEERIVSRGRRSL